MTNDCKTCPVSTGTHKPAEAVHQIAEPAAQAPDEAQIKALMRKHRIWIEHSTLLEGDEPERELRAVQAEEHQFNAFVQDLIAATQLAEAPQAVRAEVATGPCGQCKDTRQPCSCMIDTMLKERGLVAVDAAHYDKISARAKSAPAHPAEGVPAPEALEAVTKAILFEDCGSTEGWEENTNLGLAAIRALTQPQQAMAALKAAMADPEYAWSWHCAIWAGAHDEGLETGAANRAAARVMHMAFDCDTTKHANFSPEHLATHPTQQGLDAQDAARNAGINHGVCLALQIMTAAGDAGSPQWNELVDVAGRAELEHYAKVIEPEEWELAGFAQVERFKAEIASIGANSAQAKQGGAA